MVPYGFQDLLSQTLKSVEHEIHCIVEPLNKKKSLVPDDMPPRPI